MYSSKYKDLISDLRTAKIWAKGGESQIDRAISCLEHEDVDGAKQAISAARIWNDDFSSRLKLNRIKSELEHL